MPDHTAVVASGSPVATSEFEMNCLARKQSRAFPKPPPPLLVIFFAIIAQLAPTLVCVALRIINLDSPRTALQGDTIQLGCVYSFTSTPTTTTTRFRRQLPKANSSGPTWLPEDERTSSNFQDANWPTNLKSIGELESGQNEDANDHGRPPRRNGAIRRRQSSTAEMLYAIKWYKDEREFYRYIAQDWPHKQTLPLDGLHVDIEKSDNQTVVLRNVSLKTSGLFKCEVSTDAPYFVTKSIERKMLVYSLPDGGPMIERTPIRRNQPTRHFLGDHLEIVCRSRESKPAAQIDWIINDSLNLSSMTPLDPIGRPIFQLTSKHYVRLPTGPANAAAAQPMVAGASSRQNNNPNDLTARRNLAQTRPPVITIQHQSSAPANRFTTYELLNNQTDQTLTARPIESSPSASVSLAWGSLDQLLESSLSTLNFSVDANLLQLLSSLSKATKSQQAAMVQPHRKTNSPGTKWKKPNAGVGLKALNLTNAKHVDHLRSFNLQIKCSARVLHLSMSDEIKMKLSDTPRENSQQQATGTSSSHPEAQLQKQQKSMIDGNSGATSSFRQSTQTCWNLITLLSSIIITYLIVL